MLTLKVEKPCTQEMIDEAENPPVRWRWGPGSVSYEVGHGNFTDQGEARQFDYTPLLIWWPMTSHTSALLWLATSGDMPSISWNHLEYLQTRYDIHIAKLEHEHRGECERLALDQVLICMADALMKLLAGTMFHSTMQTFIQVFVVAINMRLYTQTHPELSKLQALAYLWQDVFAVIVSLSSMTKVLVDTIDVFCWCFSCMQTHEYRKIVHSAQANTEVLKRKPEYGAHVEELGRTIKARLAVCLAAWAFMLVLLEYFLVEVMMIFRCKHSLWSLVGCMDELPTTLRV